MPAKRALWAIRFVAIRICTAVHSGRIRVVFIDSSRCVAQNRDPKPNTLLAQRSRARTSTEVEFLLIDFSVSYHRRTARVKIGKCFDWQIFDCNDLARATGPYFSSIQPN